MIGFDKTRFCGEQVGCDGLHFWMDTCCMDKPNNNELAEVLNPMVRQYHDAGNFYAHLSDVAKKAFDTNNETHQLS